jgi:1,4-alpha-glucan branching enzyme
MERTWYGYDLGFPARGFWAQAFNSDVYDHWVNPWAARNGAGIRADGKPLNGFTTSGSIVIPANSVIVFVRSYGPARN